MEKPVLELRSLIYGRYKNEAKFAEELGWNRQKLNKITNGRKIPDVNEVGAIANGLNVDIGQIAKIFLNE